MERDFGGPLRSFGELRDVNGQDGTVTAVISTGNVARDGMVIDPAGWDFENYNRNPVVLWSHNDMAMPIARTVELIALEDQLVARAQLDMDDPEAIRLLGKIERGFVNSTSVRWDPKETETREIDGRKTLVFTRQELLEWSFVAIPADPGAVIVRSDGRPVEYQPEEEEPVPEPRPDVRGPAALAAATAYLRRQQDRPQRIQQLVIASLADVTGRSPERIKEEIGG